MNAQLLTKLDGLLLDLSDSDVTVLFGEIAKRMIARQQPPVDSLLLCDADNHPVGYFVPQISSRKKPCRTKEEFIKEFKRRIDNPPDRFLNTDELMALLERE